MFLQGEELARFRWTIHAGASHPCPSPRREASTCVRGFLLLTLELKELRELPYLNIVTSL